MKVSDVRNNDATTHYRSRQSYLRGISDTHPLEMEITQMKQKIEDILFSCDEKNAAFILTATAAAVRDEKAQKKFLATYKSSDQLAKEAAARKLEEAKLKAMQEKDSVEGAEERIRALNEEEASLEFTVIMHHNHLSLIGMTVHEMTKRYAKIDREKEFLELRRENQAKLTAKSLKFMEEECLSERHWIENEQQQAQKQLQQQANVFHHQFKVMLRFRPRIEFVIAEHERLALVIQEEEAEERNVVEMETALSFKAARIGAAFASLSTSLV